jgi:hypothetical protein
MKKMPLMGCIVAVMIMVSCNSTKIASSWKEPNKTVSIAKLNKVLVVALFKDETSNRKAEDQMVGYLKDVGLASYKYFKPNFDRKNEDVIREMIKMDEFDGAITMRLIDIDKDQIYTQSRSSPYPMYYRNFSGYYYRNWAYSSAPGYYSSTKTYTVETVVFSIKEDKIIWSSLTKTTDPDGVQKMTEEIAEVVHKRMVKEGFIDKK